MYIIYIYIYKYILKCVFHHTEYSYAKNVKILHLAQFIPDGQICECFLKIVAATVIVVLVHHNHFLFLQKHSIILYQLWAKFLAYCFSNLVCPLNY